MRAFCLVLIASFWLGAAVCGQTTLTLENGTSVIASQLRESGDSLRTEKGCFAKRDILHVVNGKNTYVYNVISNGLAEVRFKETCRACRSGRIYGVKYVSTLLPAADFEPKPSDQLLADTLFARFLQEEQNDRNQQTPAVELLANDLSVPLPYNGNMIVKRSGDTLRVEKDFYPKKDTLCWFGGGRMHRDDVLLVIDRHGQRVFRQRDNQLVELDETVVDRSPCSQAIVLANIHDGSAVAGTEMKGVDQGMIATSAFSACYGTEQKRLADIAARKAKTMRTLGTIGRVTRAGSAVAP